MVKIIGVLLIISSLISLIAGAFIDIRYSGDSPTKITGSFISNVLTQSKVSIGFFDYLEAVVFSYSIISFIMGVVFLFRM